MTIQAISWVLDHSRSRSLERLVLIAMANHENDGFRGVAKSTLAFEAGEISESTVWRAQQRLVECGEIVEATTDEAPSWWLDIDPRRRPRLWKLVGFLASRDAMAYAAANRSETSRTATPAAHDGRSLPSRSATAETDQGSRRDRAGVAQGSRSSATHPYSPFSSRNSKTNFAGAQSSTSNCDDCHDSGFVAGGEPCPHCLCVPCHGTGWLIGDVPGAGSTRCGACHPAATAAAR